MNPWLPFEWIAALRFMREGRTQTTLIVAGVALGVGVIVFMSALLTGMRANIFQRSLSALPQIVVLPADRVARDLRGANGGAVLLQAQAQRLRSLDQWQAVRERIARMPELLAITPVANGPGFALRGEATRAVSIIGIEPESYEKIIPLSEKIVAGRLRLTGLDVLVGTELARILGARVGDKLRLSAANNIVEVLNISGILDLGSKPANERNVYVALHTAQGMLDLVGGVSSLDIDVRDPFAAETVAQAIQAETGLNAESWIKTNAQFFTALAAQTMANTLIRFFVALTAALGIASVLVVSVVQKSKEIGILRAMGASRAQVQRIFLIQGGVMGLGGSILGCLLGWIFLMAWRGLAKNPDGSLLFPIEIEPSLFALAAVGATLVGILAAVVPSRRAARLDPVEAIRG
ncbi:MAG: ABC transporter permease [Burkholderiales bacterium]